MARQSKAKRATGGIRAFVELWSGCLARHNLLTWASAIAFQALVALVPLTLLALGILGALGEQSVWRKQISPPIRDRLPQQTFTAVNYAADRILADPSTGLLAFGVLLSLWEISGSVRAVMGALNRIHGTDETRPIGRRYARSFALAIGIATSVLGAILVVTLAKHVGGSFAWLVSAARWVVVVALLGAAVAMLVRFAPAEPRSHGWVTLGSAFVVIAWIVASLIFRWWVTSVASFRSAWGTFVAVLVLTGYLYTSATVFLVGVQADELMRKAAASGDDTIRGRVRAALG